MSSSWRNCLCSSRSAHIFCHCTYRLMRLMVIWGRSWLRPWDLTTSEIAWSITFNAFTMTSQSMEDGRCVAHEALVMHGFPSDVKDRGVLKRKLIAGLHPIMARQDSAWEMKRVITAEGSILTGSTNMAWQWKRPRWAGEDCLVNVTSFAILRKDAIGSRADNHFTPGSVGFVFVLLDASSSGLEPRHCEFVVSRVISFKPCV